MYSECRHILPSGRKCKSPALKGKYYCYFHHYLGMRLGDGASASREPLKLPSLEDARGIQTALTLVLSAFANNRIDAKMATVYLNGLQLATRLLKQAAAPAPIETIRELAHIDSDGAYVAPEQTHCDPHVDCDACPTKDTCIDAARLNLRSMHQVLRAIRHGQHDWEEKLDKAENPRPPEIPSYLTSKLERAKEAEASGKFYNGPSVIELQDQIQIFIDEHPPEKDPFGLLSLIEPDHLYNLKRALQPRS